MTVRILPLPCSCREAKLLTVTHPPYGPHPYPPTSSHSTAPSPPPPRKARTLLLGTSPGLSGVLSLEDSRGMYEGAQGLVQRGAWESLCLGYPSVCRGYGAWGGWAASMGRIRREDSLAAVGCRERSERRLRGCVNKNRNVSQCSVKVLKVLLFPGG